MSRRNIYQGKGSCYALKEGVFIPGGGVNQDTLPSFIALILRDLERGYTYDNSDCRRIRMTEDLALKRLNYLVALSRRHSGVRGKRYVEERLAELIRGFKLPRGKIRLAGRSDGLKRVVSDLKRIFGSGVRVEAVPSSGKAKRKAVVAS